MHTLFDSIVFGLVQGVTEFLPISSTAHVRLIGVITDKPDPGAAFSAVVQLGSLLSLLIYFSRDLAAIAKESFVGVIQNQWMKTESSKMGVFIGIATFPICVVGFFLADLVRGPFRSLEVIGVALISVGIWLWFAERFSSVSRKLDSMDWKASLWIGFAQCLALIPGASRSGTTLAAALMLGFCRPDALRFSFLISIPTIFLAGAHELFVEWESLLDVGLISILSASVAAFLSGYLSIVFLFRYLRTHSTLVFVYYRVVLGLLVIVWILA